MLKDSQDNQEFRFKCSLYPLPCNPSLSSATRFSKLDINHPLKSRPQFKSFQIEKNLKHYFFSLFPDTKLFYYKLKIRLTLPSYTIILKLRLPTDFPNSSCVIGSPCNSISKGNPQSLFSLTTAPSAQRGRCHAQPNQPRVRFHPPSPPSGFPSTCSIQALRFSSQPYSSCQR